MMQAIALYHFEPFLADVSSDVSAIKDGAAGKPHIDQSELDTVVVPARKEGFEEVFKGEDKWYQIRLHGTMRPLIKYHSIVSGCSQIRDYTYCPN